VSRRYLDALPALQHPVIGEIIATYSSALRREYRGGTGPPRSSAVQVDASSWRYRREHRPDRRFLLWPEKGNRPRFTSPRHANACFTPLSVIL
jgi:hypothetical protein